MSWKEIYTVVESDANIDALPEGDDPFVDKLQKEEMHRNPQYTASRIGPILEANWQLDVS